jgi:hypothetical protein
MNDTAGVGRAQPGTLVRVTGATKRCQSAGPSAPGHVNHHAVTFRDRKARGAFPDRPDKTSRRMARWRGC